MEKIEDAVKGLVWLMHKKINPVGPLGEFMNVQPTILQADSDGNRTITVRYENYYMGFCRGIYEFTVSMDKRDTIVNVKDARRVGD